MQFPKLKILDLGCNKIKHVSPSDLEKNCVSKIMFQFNNIFFLFNTFPAKVPIFCPQCIVAHKFKILQPDSVSKPSR